MAEHWNSCPGKWSFHHWRHSKRIWARCSITCSGDPALARELDWIISRDPFQSANNPDSGIRKCRRSMDESELVTKHRDSFSQLIQMEELETAVREGLKVEMLQELLGTRPADSQTMCALGCTELSWPPNRASDSNQALNTLKPCALWLTNSTYHLAHWNIN